MRIPVTIGEVALIVIAAVLIWEVALIVIAAVLIWAKLDGWG